MKMWSEDASPGARPPWRAACRPSPPGAPHPGKRPQCRPSAAASPPQPGVRKEKLALSTTCPVNQVETGCAVLGTPTAVIVPASVPDAQSTASRVTVAAQAAPPAPSGPPAPASPRPTAPAEEGR